MVTPGGALVYLRIFVIFVCVAECRHSGSATSHARTTRSGNGRGYSGTGRAQEAGSGIDRIGPCTHQDNQSQLNSFLWTLRRDPPSFFFGTIHVPYSRVWSYIPHNTKEALYRADNVYFELDLTDPYTISALANCQLLPDGTKLSDVIPRSLYQRLKQHLDYVRLMMPTWVTSDQRGRGLYADYLFDAITGNWERKRPVWVMLMVNSLTRSDIRSRGTPVLDLYLAQEAQRLQKRTGAVEEVNEQCVPLNGLNFSQVLFALNHTLWKLENSRFGEMSSTYTTEDLIRHYNCGNLDTVLFSQDTAQVPSFLNMSLSSDERATASQIDGYFREQLIYKRNQRMANRIHELLTENPNKSFFFAFGAGHFLGNNTVLHALAERGHHVTHVAPEEELDLGERYQRRRRKFPPLLADLEGSLPPPVINDNLEYLDLNHDRRYRTRHRHGGAPGGRRRTRPRTKAPPTSDNERIKYPQFNDLWVRLEASSFGPHSVFGLSGSPSTPQVPVYAMYNAAPVRPAEKLHILLLTVLLCSRHLLH